MTRRLADDYVLPFNVTDYVVALESYTQQLLNIYEPQLQRHNMTSAFGENCISGDCEHFLLIVCHGINYSGVNSGPLTQKYLQCISSVLRRL